MTTHRAEFKGRKPNRCGTVYRTTLRLKALKLGLDQRTSLTVSEDELLEFIEFRDGGATLTEANERMGWPLHQDKKPPDIVDHMTPGNGTREDLPMVHGKATVIKETRMQGSYTLSHQEVEDAVKRFLEDQGFFKTYGITPAQVEVEALGNGHAIDYGAYVEVSWDIATKEVE